MKELFEVSPTELFVIYNNLEEMGALQIRVIRFINKCLDVCVEKITINLHEYRIYFVIELPHWTPQQIQDSIRKHTEFKVAWKKKNYMISWRQTMTGESYHSATTPDELRERYKNHPAVMCNEKDSGWEIDKIVAE